MYEEYLLEIIKEKSRDDIDKDNSFLMSLVPSFKKLNDEQKFVAKVEFLNVRRRITFCQPPYHVSNPPQFQSYSNLPGPSAHTSYCNKMAFNLATTMFTNITGTIIPVLIQKLRQKCLVKPPQSVKF